MKFAIRAGVSIKEIGAQQDHTCVHAMESSRGRLDADDNQPLSKHGAYGKAYVGRWQASSERRWRDSEACTRLRRRNEWTPIIGAETRLTNPGGGTTELTYTVGCISCGSGAAGS